VSKTLKILLAILVVLILVVAGFVVGKFYWQKSNEDKEKTATSSAESAGKKSEENQQAAEEAAEGCWKEYKNQPVGYSLKYPCDWSLTETNEFNETLQMNVKLTTIHTPDNKYFLYWGYKKSAEQGFTNNDRTGVGAGDFVVKPDMAFDILGVNVVPEALVFQGKVKEYFYKQPQSGVATCSCNFIGMFSYDQAEDYDALDMTNLNYIPTVKQILQSVQKI